MLQVLPGEELVTAGLSTAAALRAATLDAAVFAGRERDFGSIAAGKVSDMLLPGADPLENVRNTPVRCFGVQLAD